MTEPAERSLNCLIAGEGPGLAFIHGAGGNASIWFQQMDAFAPTHRVIAYDLAGFGRSPALGAQDLPARLAADAGLALDRAGLRSATVVCQSLGGWSGVRLALEQPERVDRLVLASTLGGFFHPPGLQSYMDSGKQMDERGPVSLALTRDFQNAHPALAYVYNQVAAFNPPLDRSLVQSLFSPGVLLPLEHAGKVACPVLMLCGEHDPIWPPAVLEGLGAHFSDVTFRVIKGTGHSGYFERADQFNKELRAFMS